MKRASNPGGSSPPVAAVARFTDRVEDYVKARPGYPPEVVGLLAQNCGLNRNSRVVDVGCGTGLLAERFCEFGCTVIGVEPNTAMRAAGTQYLAGYENFTMLGGKAESVPLSEASVDFVSVGQAFHWFDVEAARREFLRILKPHGWAVLVSNEREFTGSKFAEDYENLVVRFGIDYAIVHQRGKTTSAAFGRFFGNDEFRRASFCNAQRLDYDKFVARVLSASYMPGPGHAGHKGMMREVQHIFEENAKGSYVTMNYTTTVIYGHLS